MAGKRSKWVTLFFWIMVTVVLSIMAPSMTKEENNNAASLPSSVPSVVATNAVNHWFPSSSGNPALLVWYRSKGLTNSDLSLLQQLTKSLAASPLIAQKSVPQLANVPVFSIRSMVSKDGSTLVVPVFFHQGADPTALQNALTQLTKRIRTAAGTNVMTSPLNSSGLHVRITGPVGIAVDAQGLFKNADVTLLAATTLIVLILLILLYRSPILAFVPLISVGFAYAVISPILGLLARSGVIVIDAQGVSIMTVLLFGAGTDYCLFMVARYRELLTAEDDKYAAIRKAVGGAAGAISMSGLTVVLSLSALLFAKYGPDHRFAVPFSLSIFVMGLAGVTLVPALLAILGRVSFFPFIPRTAEMWAEWAKRKQRHVRVHSGEPVGISRFIGELVSRKPWPVIASSVIVLGGLACFAVQIKPTYDLLASFPVSMPSRQGFQLISTHFSPGNLAPVDVVVRKPGNADAVATALGRLSFVDKVSQVRQSTLDPQVKLIQVTLKEDPYSLKAMSEIPLIRQTTVNVLSKEISSADRSVWIGGATATQYDTMYFTNLDTRTVIPIVIGVIAILLVLYLRSIIAMIYLIATVLLSYFSALGLGWVILHYAMGATAISGAIPLYSFVFLVALGEDYNIFMVSRIWQVKDQLTVREAVYEGVSRTSSVITSAGLILAGTFAVLASLPLQILVQFGIVTSLGVLIDTFVVRPFLVPSLTVVLGRWAFWPSGIRNKNRVKA